MTPEQETIRDLVLTLEQLANMVEERVAISAPFFHDSDLERKVRHAHQIAEGAWRLIGRGLQE